MKNHADLIHEIEIIKGQIEQLEISVKYWLGDSEILTLTGEGAGKYGLGTASENVDRIHKKINVLQEMLEAFVMIRDQNEKRINKLQGLGYKVARLRFIEGMSYKEIAVKLDYSYSHIRRVAMETNKLDDAI